jgi:hypothetical protein
MSRATVVLLCMVFAACSNYVDYYQQVIDKTDRVEIYYRTNNDTIVLNRLQTKTFKKVFAEKIIPKPQMNFPDDFEIALYNKNVSLGVIQLRTNPSLPFANFKSDSLSFGFALTHQMGTFFNDIKSK